jgi:hypothetical protein
MSTPPHHRTTVSVAPERQPGKRLTDRFQYRGHCLCGWVGPTLPTWQAAHTSAREHRHEEIDNATTNAWCVYDPDPIGLAWPPLVGPFPSYAAAYQYANEAHPEDGIGNALILKLVAPS